MKAGRAFWTEDDATVSCEGHEDLTDAWLRLFGERFDARGAIKSRDDGDGVLRRMPNGMLAWCSWPGGSAIHYPALEAVPEDDEGPAGERREARRWS